MAQPLYGFLDLEHVFDERVTEVGVSVVDTAITQSIEEHNRQLDALMGLFVSATTDFKVQFKTATQVRNQPLDQDGRARPIMRAGEYEVAFPLQGSGNAWGANRLSRIAMTVGEANRITAALLEGDVRWMRDHILAALFASASWTFDDSQTGGHGDLTIKGLANNDDDEYQVITGADAPAKDLHYFAQTAAIDDANDPFNADYDDLMEHPENAGAQAVALIPTNQKTAIRDLADFHPIADPNIERGSGTDVLTGSLGVTVPGEVFGYHEAGVWLSEWRSLPDNYIVMVAAGASETPLKMRQYPYAELQGFHKAAETVDYPFYEAQYVRYVGFGAWNRVAALVRLIGSASYTIPTNHTSPMP